MGWLENLKDKKKDEQAQAVLKAIPDELKDKSLDEITAILKEAPQLKSKVTELEAQRAEDTQAVTTLKTQFEEIKGKLASVDAARNTPAHSTPEPLADFIDEPDKAFAQRSGPLAQLAVNNAATTARFAAQQQLDNADLSSNGKTMDGRLFRVWGSEIDTEAKKYPTVNLINVDTWIGMYLMIKGRHADELANPDERKKKYNFLEPSTVGVQPASDNKPKDGPESLSEEEKRVAGKMGVSLEAYAKRKKAMQFVNA
jgi:hypothetical protein